MIPYGLFDDQLFITKYQFNLYPMLKHIFFEGDNFSFRVTSEKIDCARLQPLDTTVILFDSNKDLKTTLHLLQTQLKTKKKENK